MNGIISNEETTGTLVWGKRIRTDLVRVGNAWTAIVEEEVFNKVHSILKARGKSSVSQEYVEMSMNSQGEVSPIRSINKFTMLITSP